MQSPHRDFSMCLYGLPGTGKSEYGMFLAQELGLTPWRIKYSDLADKYVGDTEKKISLAFEQAKDEHKFMIIDEADSLISNRADANASWERTQVNEMLVQIEHHPYPIVCSTNLKDTIDRAALRRFTFKVEFKPFTQEHAQKAFKVIFGYDLPQGIVLPQDLTLGEYAAVKKQARFLGIEKDPQALWAAILSEAASKQVGRPMGFTAEVSKKQFSPR